MGLPTCDALAAGSAASSGGLCTICPDGEYKYGFSEECQACPSAGVMYAQQAFGAAWVAAVVIWIWRQASETDSVESTSLSKMGRAAGEVIAIVLQHTQLLAILMVVPWKFPSGLLPIMELPVVFLGVDMLGIFRIDCLGHTDGSYTARWFASQGFYFIIVVGAIVTSKVAGALSKPGLADQSWHKAVLLFGLMYTPILRGACAVHDCVEHGDVYVVEHTPEIACDYSHGVYAITAIITAVFLQVSLLIPALSLNTLHHKHGKTKEGGLGTQSDVRRFGWMFTRYRFNKYWWETFVMYKTVLTVFGGVWFSDDAATCSVMVLVALIAHLVAHIHQLPMEVTESEKPSKPLMARRGNRLSILAIVCQIVFVLVGLLSEATAGSTEQERSSGMDVLIGLLVALVYFAPLLGGAIVMLLEHNDGGSTGEAPPTRGSGEVLDVRTKSYDGDMEPLDNYTVSFDNPLESPGIDRTGSFEEPMRKSFDAEDSERPLKNVKSIKKARAQARSSPSTPIKDPTTPSDTSDSRTDEDPTSIE